MVRAPWGEEAGDAKSVIEPLVQEIDPRVHVQVNSGPGVSKSTVEVVLTKDEREARCIVTFEAWNRAREDSQEMRDAFSRIVSDIEGAAELPAYVLTSRELSTEPPDKTTDLLRMIAAGTEADILAERFFKRGVQK